MNAFTTLLLDAHLWFARLAAHNDMVRKTWRRTRASNVRAVTDTTCFAKCNSKTLSFILERDVSASRAPPAKKNEFGYNVRHCNIASGSARAGVPYAKRV